MSTVVIALGNPLRGDDGIGNVLLDRLRERGLPADVEFRDLGDGGFDVLHALADADRAVIVDAVRFGGEPGECAVFEPDDVAAVVESRGSHDSDLFELLDLAAAREEAPERVVIFGVQPGGMRAGERLSDPVETALPDLTDALVEVVEGL
ncbi:hydrogenase maturation protease [Halapricum hydrolyticum]|uniref:Hydrogenase maturation protease n=1 Tax=Halapricum hydrolyticum TaxID=2979991 RepID=A0AAE3LEP3_9EURY|nr:hydrogenase maturation protease [Halapricum hydrolyticum]MCU4717512.1 hydrogenase maturation protease [Halapricum hydrolyticum]MCU4726676.1 hydrogenase maturation protease [Halapricum hydrolyticum]